MGGGDPPPVEAYRDPPLVREAEPRKEPAGSIREIEPPTPGVAVILPMSDTANSAGVHPTAKMAHDPWVALVKSVVGIFPSKDPP